MALHRGEQMKKKFECVQGCSDCCIYRDYYPSIEYGKIGVLVLPEEKAAIERLAKKMHVRVRIIPRLAVGRVSPEKIIAYQMMGKNEDGNLCPFLDTESNERSGHGGFKCKIYSTTEASTQGLQHEIEALARIKATVTADNGVSIWRYATATGESNELLPEGWVL